MALKPIFRVPDIMARYGCSPGTARRYMRQMRHTEKPLTVTEEAILEWDDERTVPSLKERNEKTPRVPRKKKRLYHEGHLVPRTRT